MMKNVFVLAAVLCVVSSMSFGAIYVEDFEGNMGDWSLASIGWQAVLGTGTQAGLLTPYWDGTPHAAFVEHSVDPAGVGYEAVLYTTEYTVDASIENVAFEFDFGKGWIDIPTSCLTSLTVQVGGNWYVSKNSTITTVDTIVDYNLQRLFAMYTTDMSNWDVLDIATAQRGAGAASDLAGDITAFGIHTDSLVVDGILARTEIDNFTVIPEPATLCLFALGGLVLRKKSA